MNWPTREQIQELLEHDGTTSDLIERLHRAVGMALSLKDDNERLECEVSDLEFSLRSVGI